MRFLFLLLFGYLVYHFLIKPILLDARQNRQFNRFDEMQDMINRMRQQNGPYQNQAPNKNKTRSKNEGDYIDYEEVD